MRLLTVAGLLLVAAPLAGAQAEDPFCVITFTPAPDFRFLNMTLDVELTEADADALLRELDADGDGNVSEVEESSWETTTRVSRLGSNRDLGRYTMVLDYERLPDIAIERELVGVTEDGPIVKEHRRYDFWAQTRLAHAHLLDAGIGAYERGPRAVIETAVFEAPPGWRVWQVNGTTYLDDTVTLPGFDTERRFWVTWLRDGVPPEEVRGFGEPAPRGGTPGAGAAATAAAIGLAAALVALRGWAGRRRR